MTPAVFTVTDVAITAGAGTLQGPGQDPEVRRPPPRLAARRQAGRRSSCRPSPPARRSTCTPSTPTQHFTQPPPRYSEATLIKALEKENIGRPSTYAPIIQTIQDRLYVEQKERRFFATDLGMVVTDLLVKHFPKILDLKFTAHMEDELDDIATAKEDMVKVLDEFYYPFQDALKAAETQMERVSDPHQRDLPRLRRADGAEVRQDRPVPGLLEVPRVQGDPAPRRPAAGRGRRERARLPQVRQAALDPREQAGREVPLVLGLSRLQGVVQHRRRRATPCPRGSRPSTSARSAASRWPCARARAGRSWAARAIPSAATCMPVDAEGKPVADGQDRREVREVRRADGRPPGPPRGLPRLHRLSQVPRHRPGPRRAQGQARRAGPGRRPPPAGPDLKTIEVEETCEDCGGPMIVRRGRRGFFLGCSKYPKCKGTKEPGEATLEKITAVVGAGT